MSAEAVAQSALMSGIEWFGFGGVLIGTWFYGNGGMAGPFICFLAALALIIYGAAVASVAIWLTNLIFVTIHIRNLLKARPAPPEPWEGI